MALWTAVLLLGVAALEQEVAPCSGIQGLGSRLHRRVPRSVCAAEPTHPDSADGGKPFAAGVWELRDLRLHGHPGLQLLLDRAESYDLFHVPRSETELSEACGIPVTTTAAKVDVAAATPTDVTEDGAGSTNSSGNATSNPSTTAALGAADSTSTPTAVASTTSSPGLRTTQPAGTSENSTTTADGFHDALIYNFAHRHASLSWVY
eukprot:CAMPEP_0181525282 /NCGR_PEP_ID=MMETSP1110-20121109/68887_1 /TAXON_ID=174948 /ORGANISM="Symbiodinium sp., Strain CCMP421" /LENGTH=205 /DNA_ID=CAMNT_0023656081 /DNA_START=43 /DNA_END=658 /DNA_ORIENTATION=+